MSTLRLDRLRRFTLPLAGQRVCYVHLSRRPRTAHSQRARAASEAYQITISTFSFAIAPAANPAADPNYDPTTPAVLEHK